MEWKPSSPIQSDAVARKSVHQYGKSVSMTDMFKTIDGFDAFKQNVILFVLADEGFPVEIGIKHNLFEAQSLEEFNVEARKVAEALVKNFSDMINSISSIERVKDNDASFVEIEMNVEGIEEDIIILIPFTEI